MSRRNIRQEIAVGLLLVFGGCILAYMAIQVGALRVNTGTMRVSALFDNAAGLTSGAVVTIAGVDVGNVSDLAVEQGKARVGITVKESLGLHQDAAVRMRSRSVLGEKYLELEAGSKEAPLLADGGQILTVYGELEIDQMVTAMAPLLANASPEELGKALNTLALSLNRDPERLDRILNESEALVHNLRMASEEAPALVADARAAVSDLRRTVDEARPLISRTEALVDRLDGMAEPLGTAADDAPALMTDMRLAVTDARAVMGKLDRSTADLATVLENLKELDKWELRRLIREEGVLIRIKPEEVVTPDDREAVTDGP